MYGIPKRVISLCFVALSEILSLFLGGDVRENWVSCCKSNYSCRLSMISHSVVFECVAVKI